MPINSRQKGAKAESDLVTNLKALTGLDWVRTPRSGAGPIKGDLIIRGFKEKNRFTVEAKHYKDDALTSKLLLAKGQQNLDRWWEQSLEEAKVMRREPLLIFRHNRSKWLVATFIAPINTEYILYSEKAIYIMALNEWVIQEEIVWTLD